jgi:acyl carrier protein
MPSVAPRPSDTELHERFAAIVAASLRIDPARVVPSATLDELGAESLDLVEITLDVENDFAILMPERTILEVGAEVLGEGVLEADGRLTEAGRRFLALRMPQLAGELPATTSDLRATFLRVDTWLRVIRFVIDRSPRTCADCHVALVTGSPGRLRCPACSRDVDLPSGDDLNRVWVRATATEIGLQPL